MSVAQGWYFDGVHSRRHDVRILLTGDRLKVIGADVDGDYAADRVRFSQRIARIPRWIYLPDGGTCVVEDRKLLHRLALESPLEKTLHKWESRPAYAALALALVVLGLWLMIDRGLPVVVEQVAEHIPQSAEAALGEQALAGMDRYALRPTALSPQRQETLRTKLDRMARAADFLAPYRLEFRSGRAFGPNAFTLPSGIVVVTDELIAVAHGDREVLAVLAHELGHVQHRHVMRHLLEGSATALLIAGVTGDIASTTSLAASAPTLLLQVKFSRNYEREADRFALDLLERSNIDARHFAAILKRLDAFASSRNGAPTFLSSHPATEERRAIALKGAADLDEEDESDGAGQSHANAQAQAATSTPQPAQVTLLDPAKWQIVALLSQRDYDELENTLQPYQTAFERDPATSVQLEAAFASFAKLSPVLAPNLDGWVAQKPSSYAAAVARGNFYLHRGLDARGTKWSSETPAAALAEMQTHLRAARADLDRSVALTAKPYLSHRYLLQVERQVGDSHERRLQYEQAARWAPQSVELRLSYMGTLEPRWGGSYPEMEAFLAASRSELKDPQSVRRLAARIPANRGDDARRDKDYPRALSYYTEASELDPTADNLCDRAQQLSELKHFEEAFKVAGRVLAMNQPERRCASTLVYLATRVADANEAIDLMGRLIALDPSGVDAINQRSVLYLRAGKPDLAFQDGMKSAELGSGWGQYQVSSMYWQGLGVAQDREQAVAWMRKAAAQDFPQSKVALQRYLGQLGRK